MKPRIFHVGETKLDYDGMFSSETPAPISTNVKVIEYTAYEKVEALLKQAFESLNIEGSDGKCNKSCVDYGGCCGAQCEFVEKVKSDIKEYFTKPTSGS